MSHASPQPSELSADEARTLLREAGLRSTAPRIAVYRALSRATTPRSHSELTNELGGEGLDRATIYRNLLDLASAGLANRVDLGDHVWRFELRREGDHLAAHPHFTCLGCGRVDCLTDVDIKVKSRGQGKGIAGHILQEVQLRGRCETCA